MCDPVVYIYIHICIWIKAETLMINSKQSECITAPRLIWNQTKHSLVQTKSENGMQRDISQSDIRNYPAEKKESLVTKPSLLKESLIIPE